MQWNRIMSEWPLRQGDFQRNWSRLSMDDLREVGGDREELERRLCAAYGKDREEVSREVEEFCQRLR